MRHESAAAAAAPLQNRRKNRDSSRTVKDAPFSAFGKKYRLGRWYQFLLLGETWRGIARLVGFRSAAAILSEKRETSRFTLVGPGLAHLVGHEDRQPSTAK